MQKRHALRFHVLAAWLIATAAACDGGATGPGSGVDARPIVYFRLSEPDGGWTIYRVSASGGAPTRLSLQVTETVYPAVSPDGSRLAFVSEAEPAGIYVSAADGSGAQQVHPGRAEHIAWSPDGARLAFEVDGEIIVVNANGTGTETITTGVDVHAGHPSWSSTGRIAFSTKSQFSLEADIYTMAANGSDVRLVVTGGGEEARDPAWSPDGSRLAFAFGQFGASSIFTVDANGNNRQRVTDGDASGATDLGPAWAPSGRWIAFQRQHGDCATQICGRNDVFVTRAAGGDLRNLTEGSPWGGVRPSW